MDIGRWFRNGPESTVHSLLRAVVALDAQIAFSPAVEIVGLGALSAEAAAAQPADLLLELGELLVEGGQQALVLCGPRFYLGDEFLLSLRVGNLLGANLRQAVPDGDLVTEQLIGRFDCFLALVLGATLVKRPGLAVLDDRFGLFLEFA